MVAVVVGVVVGVVVADGVVVVVGVGVAVAVAVVVVFAVVVAVAVVVGVVVGVVVVVAVAVAVVVAVGVLDSFEGGDAMRRLGSTEIASVCALYEPKLALELPKSKTACDVWLRLMYGFEQRKTASMTRGNDVEPIALDYYREHVGPAWRPVPSGEWWTVVDPVNPDFTASPDAVDREREPRVVIEAKSWSETWGRAHWGEPGTDRMATRFLYQCQWLMARTRTEETHVLVMFGNDVPVESDAGEPQSYFQITEPAIYRTVRDDDFIARLDAYGARFISEFVRTGIPPPVKPAHNRRSMKEKFNEQGNYAVDEWNRRCQEYAAAHNTDELGRPATAGQTDAGGEVGGSDGVH